MSATASASPASAAAAAAAASSSVPSTDLTEDVLSGRATAAQVWERIAREAPDSDDVTRLVLYAIRDAFSKAKSEDGDNDVKLEDDKIVRDRLAVLDAVLTHLVSVCTKEFQATVREELADFSGDSDFRDFFGPFFYSNVPCTVGRYKLMRETLYTLAEAELLSDELVYGLFANTHAPISAFLMAKDPRLQCYKPGRLLLRRLFDYPRDKSASNDEGARKARLAHELYTTFLERGAPLPKSHEKWWCSAEGMEEMTPRLAVELLRRGVSIPLDYNFAEVSPDTVAAVLEYLSRDSSCAVYGFSGDRRYTTVADGNKRARQPSADAADDEDPESKRSRTA